MNCLTCKHSVSWNYYWCGDHSILACGYNPPVVVQYGDPSEYVSVSMLPKVPSDHVCSKFEKGA